MMNIRRIQKIIFVFIASLAACLEMSCFFVAAKSTIQLKHIELKKNPYRLEIGLDEKPPCKIITIGPKEYLIALNNVKAQQRFGLRGMRNR